MHLLWMAQFSHVSLPVYGFNTWDLDPICDELVHLYDTYGEYSTHMPILFQSQPRELYRTLFGIFPPTSASYQDLDPELVLATKIKGVMSKSTGMHK